VVVVGDARYTARDVVLAGPDGATFTAAVAVRVRTSRVTTALPGL